MPKIATGYVKNEYDKKYEKEHYYRLNVVLKKEMRETIDAAAAAAGQSKNSWVAQAIQERLDRESL